MTKEFLTDFAERKRQVRHYLSVVMTVEKNTPIGSATRAQSRRLMTLRGGTFLLLYNLIEATLRGAVETIHGEIATTSTPFDKLSGELRLQVVRLFKNKADPEAYALKDVPAEFVALALSYDVKMSGSVDARSIRVLGKTYGFSCHTDHSKTAGGADLLTIKSNRNDLAHGLKTFEEVGRNYTANELVEISRRSTRFMFEILTNIEAFLDNEAYAA